MKLHNLKSTKGSRETKYRVGRGMAQGRGKQAGRGQSGQNKRNGHRPGFEGGQNPWFRRLPKIGFKNFTHVEHQIISLAMLENKFTNNDVVDIPLLKKAGLIKSINKPVKVLANGLLKKKLTVEAHAFSKKAEEMIKKVGGSTKILAFKK